MELKEASTRRKILALKQQLQSGNKPPATAPAKQSVYTSTNTKASIPASKSDQSVLSSNMQNTPKTTAYLSNLPIQIPSSHKVPNAFSKSDQGTIESRAVHTQHSGDSERINKVSAPTETHKVSPTPEINRLTISDSDTDPPIRKKFEQETKLQEKVVEQESKLPPVISPSSKTAPSNSCPKLTLPEEIKETEYMSALQRQKARVSRIRRCIVAATVIQRAWRDYILTRKETDDIKL